MKLTLFALAFFCYIFPLSAQDTTNIKHFTDSLTIKHPSRGAKPYLLYNYTSQMGNSAFNEQFRGDANDRIILDGNFYADSKGVPSGFAYNLLFNKPISESLINRADKNLGNYLKFEESLNAGFTYERYLKKDDITLLLGYNYRQMFNLTGPKQGFETIFYGNARFAGDTVNLSNIRFDYYNYNQASIGIMKKIDYGKYQMEFAVTGSFLQVINNIDLQTQNTSLYTAPYGQSIDFNYNITYNSATNLQPNFDSLNGIGASADFHLAFSNKDKWRLSVDVRDLGIMTFRKHEYNYVGSNNINYTGFVIPNLVNFSSQTFGSLNLDSTLLSKLPGKSNNTYQLFIPFTTNVTFSKPLLNDRLVLTAGFQYKFLPYYYGYGYVKANYFITSDMVFSASAGAGGYSLFDLGVEFSKSWKYFDFAVGSSNLLGLVAPGYYSGGSLYLKLGTTF